MDGRDKVEQAMKALQQADVWLSRTVKSDDIAQVQLDIQCCIHYLGAELSRMESSDVR